MNINVTDFSPETKKDINTMKEIIDGAKASIEDEFSRTVNPRTACFAGVTDVIDVYWAIIKKRTNIDQEEYSKVNEKIEELKKELWELRQRYTEKSMQPSNEEKKSLFVHLSEIKKMVEQYEMIISKQ